MRYALIQAAAANVAPYLPSNYKVVPSATDNPTMIEGEDAYGWTLDDYVLPRLASGLIFGRETDETGQEI